MWAKGKVASVCGERGIWLSIGNGLKWEVLAEK